jgi:hypothetical protein
MYVPTNTDKCTQKNMVRYLHLGIGMHVTFFKTIDFSSTRKQCQEFRKQNK